MYEKLDKLNDPTINKLRDLKNSVPLANKEIRLGINRTDNLSIYKTSKWKDWSKSQRDEFKRCFNSVYVEKSVIGWFLDFPSDSGFLDLMNAWKDSSNCGTVIAYALDDQEIYINKLPIQIKAGEGIKFKLSVDHEIKKSSSDRSWACLMLMVP
jgi:hypothetical protein